MSYLDLLIILVLVYYLYDGYKRGVLVVLLELVVFVISIVLAFWLGNSVGVLLAGPVGIPKVYGPALGFIFVWFVAQLVLSIAKGYITISIPPRLQNSKWNKIAGVITSVTRGMVFISLILLFITVTPISGGLKNIINQSKIGTVFVNNGGYLDSLIGRLFGKSTNDMVTFLTINPSTNEKSLPADRILKPSETLQLGFKTENIRYDAVSENKMLELVNQARYEAGLGNLVFDEKLQKVARSHGRDMFARGYFSHITPDGADPFERMVDAGINYQTAGENLALAPTVELAQTGLMNSPGHRANILEQKFGHVGIGVVDGGVYGKIFVQEFTD